MKISEHEGWRGFNKDEVAGVKKQQGDQGEDKKVWCSLSEPAGSMYLRNTCTIVMLLWYSSNINNKVYNTQQQKMGLMEDRQQLQKKNEKQRQLQDKYEKLYAEVKELRKLKYAADRKAKGPVGVAR